MKWAVARNCRPLAIKDIPVAGIHELRTEIISACRSGQRPVGFFGVKEEEQIKLYAILADDENSSLSIGSSVVVPLSSYQSITLEIPSFHMFEREIHEEFGIIPEGHPWLKGVRYPHYRSDRSSVMENYPFFHMDGDEVHEVAVGPVHAGVIEPGHFRFSCNGEYVNHLEIQLGYQHRGIEPLFNSGKLADKILLAESIAGDTVIGHASAYCMAVEAMSGIHVSRRCEAVRGVAAELERAAVHIGDLAAIANDIAYLPGSSIFGAMRTTIINTSLAICGSRFGRGLLKPGGANFDIDAEANARIKATIDDVEKRTELMATAMFRDSGVIARLEKTGIVTPKSAKAVGLVGMSGRASGVKTDIRADHPYGVYSYFPVYPKVMETGDVYARAYLRYLEIIQSFNYIKEILSCMPDDNRNGHHDCSIMPDHIAVAMTEGWRGEIAHTLITDKNGSVLRYKIKDPSFNNWYGLALAVRNNGISDFPLCNKSFNLSYCGFDL